MLSKSPIYLDDNTTLSKGQKNTINSLLVSRWNWMRTKFQQKQKSNSIATNNSSRNTARVFTLYCIEYFYTGIASFYLYSYGLKSGKEYKLFDALNTPTDVRYNGMVGNYSSNDISAYGDIYFVDKTCYFKPNKDIEDSYSIITIKWRYE